ncbi:MAG: class I lanthipeptide [Bacteroidetes bacterium]|nr:class I lanthipeptide [Bacteroidota bacterium]
MKKIEFGNILQLQKDTVARLTNSEWDNKMPKPTLQPLPPDPRSEPTRTDCMCPIETPPDPPLKPMSVCETGPLAAR